jgi:hypothetical protein
MNAVTVTKSIRLLPEEAQEVARLSEQLAASEATLMKQWIRDGLRAQKIDLALRSYMQRQTDLRSAATLAGVSYNRFLSEVQMHNIVILPEEGFLDRLALLADVLNDSSLQAAVERANAQETGSPASAVDRP